jgi:hypothetical protein
MAKANCWEVKRCERQPGGSKEIELGVCPAAVSRAEDGLNGGSAAGRVCWRVAGTLCGGKAQGSYSSKITACTACEFFQQVKSDEGAAFRL